MKVKFSLSIGYGSRDEVVELPDNMPEDAIHQELLAWSDEYIDVGFDIIEGDDDE